MEKILIVEDDISIRKELQELLETAGYEVESITDFSNTLEQLQQAVVDLILLDIQIPNRNGQFLLKELRKTSNAPVIMVTSKNQETDEVLSMSYGADDYITKPYNPTILLLRINNLLKRLQNRPDHYQYHGLIVQPEKGMMKKDQEEVLLTKNEMLIFSYLLSHQNQIVTRDELMTELWNNSEYINDNALTVNISRLRTKLKEIGYQELLETRKGQGYILK